MGSSILIHQFTAGNYSYLLLGYSLSISLATLLSLHNVKARQRQKRTVKYKKNLRNFFSFPYISKDIIRLLKNIWRRWWIFSYLHDIWSELFVDGCAIVTVMDCFCLHFDRVWKRRQNEKYGSGGREVKNYCSNKINTSLLLVTSHRNKIIAF